MTGPREGQGASPHLGKELPKPDTVWWPWFHTVAQAGYQMSSLKLLAQQTFHLSTLWLLSISAWE